MLKSVNSTHHNGISNCATIYCTTGNTEHISVILIRMIKFYKIMNLLTLYLKFGTEVCLLWIGGVIFFPPVHF